MRTRVCIIGAGPSGMLLARLLGLRGIETVVLERRSAEHVLSRIRAGVLERGLVALMEEAGLAERLHREGLVHEGVVIAHGEQQIRIDFGALAHAHVVVYGQTEITRDLYGAAERSGQKMFFEVDQVAIGDVGTERPFVTFRDRDGVSRRVDCDYVAGCDGFHGVSRRTIPDRVRREYEKVYPFGWLGVLSRTPPVHDELVYSASERGFALCSMRSPSLSRYYIQVPLSDRPEDWSDAAFWDELRRRIPPEHAERLVTGPAVEKSIAPLRSFVATPMAWGRLLLCGDAAHIVPPTGAKGLNTAASDVHYLYHALAAALLDGEQEGLESYSHKALARVWKAERFSWWMTGLLHRFPDMSPFDLNMQRAEFEHLAELREAQAVLAINYTGLPY